MAELHASFSAEAMDLVRRELTKLRHAVALTPGAGGTPLPPPLLLCREEMLLHRESSIALLGGPDSALLAPPFTGIDRITVKEALEGIEVVGIYFSASWCPPCKRFTPQLAKAHTWLKDHGKGFEVVLASMDRDEVAFDEYRKAMPWPALPFHSSVVTALADRYRVQGIPKLVLVNAEGEIISDDGVRLLRKHAKAFPWSRAKPPETPHLHGLHERLLRHDAVDPGSRQELPRYKEIDMIAQPARVETHTDAVAAVRWCDWLATALAVQSHSVHNTNFLKVALIEFTFTQLLPVPAPEKTKDADACLWRVPMLYDEQLSLLILLQRIIEHFASSALSLNHTRSMDAVRMVVPAVVAAIADCVMRQLATNIPSEVTQHLRGVVDGDAKHKGFALDADALAAQSAVVVCHTPEINLARTRTLDYFASHSNLTKVFQWDKTKDLTPGLCKWLRFVCADRTFPADNGSMIKYMTDIDALLIKNYPEFRCYRDIAFYFKFFLNPDIRCFPGVDHATSQ
eukprot:2139850-Prymnesium_polylepis.1